MTPLAIHNEIDILTESAPKAGVLDRVRELVAVNADAKAYFFDRADERWLSFLWKNGLLDAIKQKSEDPTRYGYTMPELGYLEKVAEKDPGAVAGLIEKIPVSEETLNPEVIDQFLRIVSNFPASEISRILLKMQKEKWAELMRGFSSSEFSYREMFETLEKENRWKEIFALAGMTLAARPEGSAERLSIDSGNPFLFARPFETGVFEMLRKTLAFEAGDARIEEAFAVALGALGNVSAIGGSEKSKGTQFPVGDFWFLGDVDFFCVSPGEEESGSYFDAEKELAGLCAGLARKLLEGRCGEGDFARGVYEKYVLTLARTRAAWRFSLFFFSLCPEVFRKEIRDAVFLIFDARDPYEIASGAEYEQLLGQCFKNFSEAEQRKYVAEVFRVFSGEENLPVGWMMLSRLLSLGFLTEEEKKRAKDAVEAPLKKPLNPAYVPTPSFQHKSVGFIHQGPLGTEAEWARSVADIVASLENEWSPKALYKEQQKRERENPENFYQEVSANGTAMRLKEEMQKRPNDFFEGAARFFDREKLDACYTAAFFQGVSDRLREKNFPSDAGTGAVLALAKNILESHARESFVDKAKQEEGIVRRDGWRSVFYWMAETIKLSLQEDAEKERFPFLKFRADVFWCLRELLRYPSPTPKGEQKSYVPKERGYSGNNPYEVAINSVRGRAFETLVPFLFHDGKRLEKEGRKEKMADDVKSLFEKTITEEQAQAIRFLVGRHFPSFYYRDMKWAGALIEKIFSPDGADHALAIASWEGLLSGNLYREIFFDTEMQKIYERYIAFDPASYPKRPYFRDLDEGLATHLALAFAHFGEKFTFKNSLFEFFWKTKNEKRHAEFVKFLGRYCVSDEGALAITKTAEDKKALLAKLETFWDFALTLEEPETLASFGSWTRPEQSVFENEARIVKRLAQSLEISGGEIDWDYGLAQKLPDFARVAPSETLSILHSYLLGKRNPDRRWVFVDDKLKSAFEILLENSDTRPETLSLINDLLTTPNSRQYWELGDLAKQYVSA